MVLNYHLLNGDGIVTLITWQDGGPLFRDGKVGTGQDCCCESGRCCGDYSNCQVTYKVTLSDNTTIDSGGYLTIGNDPSIEDITSGNFNAIAFNFDGECFLNLSWGSEFFCEESFDVVGYSVELRYKLSCVSCCESPAHAYNCTLQFLGSETIIDPPCGDAAPGLGEPYVTGIELLSFSCDDTECNDFP